MENMEKPGAIPNLLLAAFLFLCMEEEDHGVMAVLMVFLLLLEVVVVRIVELILLEGQLLRMVVRT